MIFSGLQMKIIFRNDTETNRHTTIFQYDGRNRSTILNGNKQIPLENKLLILVTGESIVLRTITGSASPTGLMDTILLRSIPPVKTEIGADDLILEITHMLQNDDTMHLPRTGVVPRYVAYTKDAEENNNVSGFFVDGYLYDHPAMIVKDPELHGNYYLYTNSGLHLYIDKPKTDRHFKLSNGSRLTLTVNDILTLTQVPLPTTHKTYRENAKRNLNFSISDIEYERLRLYFLGLIKEPVNHRMPFMKPTSYAYEVFSQL